MSEIVNVVLAGATVDWIRENTSWGREGRPVDTSAKDKILAAPAIKAGKGYRVRVALTEDEARGLFGILDSIAGAGESMTSEEKGSDAYAYWVMRRDAERILATLDAAS